MSAFAAAKNSAFTLVVDCPVKIHSGLDIAKVIYIDNGTTVEFTAAGKFIVDNIMHPAFVIANSTGVTMTNWNVEFDASLPVNSNVGGYLMNGQSVSQPNGSEQPSGPWNDLELTPWMAANRGIVFSHVKSYWASPTNACAVFFLTGDTSQVSITGLNVSVPTTAGGDHFVPVVFSFSPNYKNNQTVTASTPLAAKYFAVPHDLTFSNIVYDGTYMGWVGTVQNATFEHVRSHRYGDLQDANGDHVGGIGKWFAPPHLFYLTYSISEDPALFNKAITISDVVDDGPRVGTARDKGGSDPASGYALSLKIGCIDCSVDTYTTTRPDGFLDVLPSNGLTISNVSASYNSQFLNNLYPAWRFPLTGYNNITFENITVQDTATSSVHPPIGDATHTESNSGIVFKNVQATLKSWAQSNYNNLLPNILGTDTNVEVTFVIADTAAQIAGNQQDTESLMLSATHASGSSTELNWNSKSANSCAASGAWTGTVHTTGSATVKQSATGIASYTLACQNATGASAVTLQLAAQ